MLEILNAISTMKQDKNPTGNLVKFQRLIDPVILATFYGLYKSKELPPLTEEEFLLENSYEFGNVDIGDFSDKLNHFLFCLWVKQNGFPNINVDILTYREKLYSFISKILSEKYFIGVVIPFYLKKADESEGDRSSFVHRLWSSDNIEMISEMYSPEFLAKEFNLVQSEFITDVIAAVSNQPFPVISKVVDILVNDESETFEFKSSLRYDVKAAEHGQDKTNPALEKEVLSTICAFLNSNGGTLVIGVSDDKKVLGLKNDYKRLHLKQDKDGFEVFLRNKLTQNIQPDIPGLVTISFEPYGDKEICLVNVKKSYKPMFLKEEISGRVIQTFWIREGNRTRSIEGVSLASYIQRYHSES